MIPGVIAVGAELMKIGRGIPWQAWAVASLLLAVGLYGCDQYRQGEQDAAVNIERKQQEAADAARKEADRVLRGDRSRVMQFDRD